MRDRKTKGGAKVLTLQDVVRTAGRTAEAQRRFPYWIIWAIGLIAMGSVIGTALHAFPWQDSGSIPAVQSEQQTQIGPVIQQPAAQPASSADKPVAPAPVAWPFVQVTWTPVTDLSILPPAEQGFYNGTMENSSGLFNSIGTHEWGVYAAKIVAGRYQYTDLDLSSAGAAISRDPNNSQIVLAGLDLTHVVPSTDPHAVPPRVFPTARLFLSTDGEKTWREINLTPPKFEGAVVLPWETRVVSQGDGSILLFVMGGGGAARNGHWWTATVP